MIPDFRVGASVVRRVVGRDGRKRVVAATKEERERGVGEDLLDTEGDSGIVGGPIC